MTTSQDLEYMQLAIQLAHRGRFTTSPNPNVGCVIVKNGQIVGQGWHKKAGTPHAEVHALADAREKAEGAHCYVTLEPCSHFGRTPPCAEALVKAKVAKVFVGMKDPNPLVAGKGIQILRDAGIEVEVGILTAACEQLNQGFLKRMRSALPFVTCKLASSIDGATALANGESKWITGPAARRDVQRYRAESCAILTGAETVLTDNPSLNVRWQELGDVQSHYPEQALRQPAKIIIDSKKRITPNLKLFSLPGEIILATTEGKYEVEFGDNVTILQLEQNQGFVDLQQLLEQLAERQLNNIWLEAGGKLAGAMLQQQLIDQIILYQAAKIMGSETKPLFDIKLDKMALATELEITDLRMVGADIKFCAIPKY